MAPCAFILGLYAVTSGLGLTLSVSSDAKMIEARDRTRDISLADVLRFAAMVTLLPGIVSRRPAIHATQMIVLMLMLVVGLLQVAEPIA